MNGGKDYAAQQPVSSEYLGIYEAIWHDHWHQGLFIFYGSLQVLPYFISTGSGDTDTR